VEGDGEVGQRVALDLTGVADVVGVGALPGGDVDLLVVGQRQGLVHAQRWVIAV